MSNNKTFRKLSYFPLAIHNGTSLILTILLCSLTNLTFAKVHLPPSYDELLSRKYRMPRSNPNKPSPLPITRLTSPRTPYILDNENELDAKELTSRDEKGVKVNKQILTALSCISMLGIYIGFHYNYRMKRTKNTVEAIKQKNQELEKTIKNLESTNEHLCESTKKLNEQYLEIKAKLNSNLLYISSAKNLLELLHENIKKMETPLHEKKKILSLINSMRRTDLWNRIEEKYLQRHNEFISVLATKYPKISSNNLTLCILIKLGLSVKEIAQVRHSSEESVRMARTRLRKLFNIEDPNITIFAFLNALTHFD